MTEGIKPLPPLVCFGSHSSGRSIIRSTTSPKASFTPTAVLADASINKESIREAKDWASAVGTWRENSLRERIMYSEYYSR